MKFERQKQRFVVDKMDVAESSTGASHRHGMLLPHSIRSIIAGPSACGKTNLMVTLLTHPHGLGFHNVYLFSKSLYQPKYQFLERVLRPIRGMGYHPYSDNDEIMKPSEAKSNSVFIFDDVACEKQHVIREYFSMGRHNNVDAFYLCQTYSRIPKQLVRDNANLIVLFKQDEKNLRHAFMDHVTPDISFEKFRELCSRCWERDYGFVTIVKDAPLVNGRYRQGLDCYIKEF